jgi:hypothetical protein
VNSALDPSQTLGNLPQGLRDELMEEYARITKNFARGEWGSAALYGGRFCEVVYAILKGHVDGSFPKLASKPTNFPQKCRDLEQQADKSKFPQSVRIGIPRLLIGLYEFRNNRDSGHVGGEVDANHMDATYVLHAAQWVMAELVRLFHAADVETATATVEALVERTLPLIWEVNGRRRILDPKMLLADKTLLLLYGSTSGMSDADLAADIKHGRLRDYKKILRSLDEQVLVEYEEESGHAQISPTGKGDVETRLLPTLVLG